MLTIEGLINHTRKELAEEPYYLAILNVLKQKPIILPFWSPFGALLNGGS